MKLTYNKQEKLKSKKLLQLLFEEGEKISVFPMMLLYLQVTHNSNYPIQAGVTVSKKNFNKAVDRNRIKRLMREIYRLNKPSFYEGLTNKYIFMFIYLGKTEVKYQFLDEIMKLLLTQFKNKIAKK